MEMSHLKMNMLISEKFHLINSLDRSNHHPLISKISKIPFNK